MSLEFFGPPPDEELLPQQRRPPSWRAVAIVITALVVLAGIGSAIWAHRGHHTKPSAAGQHTTTAPAPHSSAALHSSAAPQPSVEQRTTCSAGLPATWHQAMSAGTAGFGRRRVQVDGVSAQGTVIGSYMPTTRTGTLGVTVGAVSLSTHTVRPLATFTAQSAQLASDVQVAGDAALVSLEFEAHNSPTPTLTRLAVVDTRTGAVTTLRTLRGKRAPTIGSAVLFGGAVFWDEHTDGNGGREIVHRYDLASRTSRTVYDADYGESLQYSAAGISWHDVATPDVPAQLPASVARYMTGSDVRESLTSDGDAYAWQSGHAIDWWAPGGQTTQFRVGASGLAGVAGPIVFFGKDSNELLYLLDARTGAVVALRDTWMSSSAHGQAFLANQPHVITDHTVYTVTRLDTASLPPLSC